MDVVAEPSDGSRRAEHDAARARVLIALARPAVPATLRPPSLMTGRPLRPVPAPVAARLSARSQAGLEPLGTGYPRAGRWQLVVVPGAAAAAVDSGVLLVAALTGHGFAGGVAALVLATLVAVVAVAALSALRDPLRLTRDERRGLNQVSYWESRQSWIGPLSARPERALVTTALDAVGRIVRTESWGSRHLDEHRLRLNLVAELDEIDAQAFGIASARRGIAAEHGPSPDVPAPPEPHESSIESVWLAAVDRVAALDSYAVHLAALDQHLVDLGALDRADHQVGELLAGSVRDEFAVDHVRSLSDELEYVRTAIDDTLALLHSDARALAPTPRHS
jgi:hypothetical protein